MKMNSVPRISDIEGNLHLENINYHNTAAHSSLPSDHSSLLSDHSSLLSDHSSLLSDHSSLRLGISLVQKIVSLAKELNDGISLLIF